LNLDNLFTLLHGDRLLVGLRIAPQGGQEVTDAYMRTPPSVG
jgi:hypothetical protein